MLGVVVNTLLVILGGVLGVLFRSRIKEGLVKTLMTAMGLAVLVIGIDGAADVVDITAVVVCLAIGGIIGHALKIDDFFNGLSDKIRAKTENTRFGGGSFGEGFVTASVLFTVGSMTIIGSVEAGINGNYSILITKGVLDMVSTITFTAAMGLGVPFAFITVFVYESILTLLASVVSPYLGTEVIANMTAIGGALFIGMGLNLLGIFDKKIKVNDLLPAVLLPILYTPVTNWLGGLL